MRWLAGITLGLLLLFQAGNCYAGDISLAWDPNSETDLGGYKIYYKIGSSGPPYNGTGATEGSSPINVGNITEFTVRDLMNGIEYFFVATAYDTEVPSLESGYSNEVLAVPEGSSDTTPPGITTGFEIDDIQFIQIPEPEPVLETLVSGPGDIWDAAYDPTWVYQQVSGDFDVSIKLTADDINVPWEMAGILFETGPETDTVLLCLQASNSYGLHFQRRDTVNNNSVTFDTDGNGVSPCWLRMKRIGEVFTCYYATSEGHWIEILVSSGALSSSVDGILGVVALHPDGDQFTVYFERLSGWND